MSMAVESDGKLPAKDSREHFAKIPHTVAGGADTYQFARMICRSLRSIGRMAS